MRPAPPARSKAPSAAGSPPGGRRQLSQERLAPALLCAVFGLQQLVPLEDSAIWWQLHGGRRVLEECWFAFAGPGGATWVDGSWVPHLVLLGGWSLGGPVALQLLRSLSASALALILCALAARLAPARRGVGLLGVALACAVSCTPLELGPTSLSLIALAGSLLILQGPLGLRSGLGLAALQLVWVHSHLAALLLPLMLLVSAGDQWLAGVATEARRRALWGLGLLVGLLLLGPWGPGEWLLLLRDLEGVSWEALLPLGLGPQAWAWLLAGLTLHRLLIRGGRPGDLLFCVLGAAVAAFDLGHAALLWLPALLREPDAVTGRIPLSLQRWLTPALALLLALGCLWLGRGLGPGLSSSAQPTAVDQALAQHGGRGVIEADPEAAGYLAWRLAHLQVSPSSPPVEHFRAPGGLPLTMGEGHAPRHVVLRRDDPSCSVLRSDPDWRVVYAEEDRLLLTRDPALLPGLDLQVLGACSPALAGCPSAEEARAAGLEAQHLAAVAPASGWPDLVALRLASCGPVVGEQLEAQLQGSAGLTLGPTDLGRLAVQAARNGQLARALQLCERARRQGATAQAELLRARILAEQGDLQRAAEVMSDAAAELDDGMMLRDRLALAQLLAAAGRREEAYSQALRGAWAGDAAALSLLAELAPSVAPGRAAEGQAWRDAWSGVAGQPARGQGGAP
jgi:hypothetical protein